MAVEAYSRKMVAWFENNVFPIIGARVAPLTVGIASVLIYRAIPSRMGMGGHLVRVTVSKPSQLEPHLTRTLNFRL